MRPIIRPNGQYHADSMGVNSLAGGIGNNNPTKCLALCIRRERERLQQIINQIGGQPSAIANAIANNLGLAPLSAPTIVVPQTLPFQGGNLWQAIESIPAINHQRLLESYSHYLIIEINLQYNSAQDTFIQGPALIISDIPFAASALQDTFANMPNPGYIYSDGHGNVAVSPAFQFGSIKQYTTAQVATHLSTLYNAWQTRANSNPIPYSGAASELVSQLGPYCSYCEANLKTQIDVEHVLPKSRGQRIDGIPQGFPSHSKSWLNFLPSCPRCNSTKQAHPSKQELTRLATNQAAGMFSKRDNTQINPTFSLNGGGDPHINDLEYLEILSEVVEIPLNPDAYQDFGFVLWDSTNNQPDLTPIAQQLQWTIAGIDEIQKHVQITEPGGNQTTFQVLVDDGQIPGAHPLGTNPNAANRVAAVTQFCGLNASHANTDRRVLERTEAWFMALEAVSHLNTLAGNAADANQLLLLYQTWEYGLIRMVKEKGFFTVWLKILSQFPDPNVPNPPAGHTLATPVAAQFQNLQNQGYFRGTNYQNVP